MPLKGLRRMDALASKPVRRRPWRIRVAVLISLLIHVAIGALLLVTIRREEKSELLPPPAPVTMVFESGRRSGPTLPNPSLQARPAQPPSPNLPPADEVPLPAPPVPPTTRPLPPPPAAPPPVEAPAPKPEPAPPAQQTPPPVEASPPKPEPPPPAEPAPPPPPPPPTAAEEEAPPLPPPPSPPPVAKPAPPQPQRPPKPQPPKPPPPKPQPPKPAAPANPSDFPAPMNFSFGSPQVARKAAPRQASRPHIPGTIDMSLGPASRGVANPTPYSDRDDDAAGADWRNLLSRWVAEHAYYPDQARRLGEEGDAKVHVIASADGRVKEVELIGKSGSMWLDLGLQSMFRDAHIPPFPSGGDAPIEFNFIMHYVLIRPQ